MFTTDASGRVTGRTTGAGARGQMSPAIESPEYNRVRAPALAIYRRVDAPVLTRPWLADDTAALDGLDSWLDARVRPEIQRQINQFRQIPESCVVVLGGFHYIFISNTEEVAEIVLRFLITGECTPVTSAAE